MLKTTLIVLAITASITASAVGQEQRPQPKPKPVPAESPRMPQPDMIRIPTAPAGEPVNVKLELTITDQAGPGEASKKVITMIVADGRNGSIRTKGYQKQADVVREVIMNVDARPVIRREGILVELGLEYLPASSVAAAPGGATSDGPRSNLNERIVFMIDSGKPLIVSQAVDPLSDRKITVEVTATIMK